MSRELASPSPGTPGGGAVGAAAKSWLPGCIVDACAIINPLQLPLEYSAIIHQEHIFYAQNLLIETIKRRSERNSRVRACLCAPCPAHLSAECCNKIAGLKLARLFFFLGLPLPRCFGGIALRLTDRQFLRAPETL